MTPQERAQLVRGLRSELKGAAGDHVFYRPRTRRAPTAAPGDYRNRNPNASDNARDYVNGGAGDGGIFDRAARWDRYRALTRNPRRRKRMARAERDPGGYVGYTGDWANHFNHSTPGVGPARPK